MNTEHGRLFAQIHSIAADIERRLDAYRAQLKYQLSKGKARPECMKAVLSVPLSDGAVLTRRMRARSN